MNKGSEQDLLAAVRTAQSDIVAPPGHRAVALSDHSASPAPSVSPDDNLIAALGEVFSDPDRIVADRWRFEPAHPLGPAHVTIPSDPSGDGRVAMARLQRDGLLPLAAVRGLLDARRSLGQNHWVIVVTKGDLEDHKDRDLWRALAHNERLLVVCCQDAAPSGPETRSSGEKSKDAYRALATELDLIYIGPAAVTKRGELVRALRGIRDRDHSVLLHLTLPHAAGASGTNASAAALLNGLHAPPQAPTPRPLVVPSQAASSAAQWLARQAEIDSRIMLIDMASTAPGELAARLADRYFALPVPRTDTQHWYQQIAPDVLAWCAGLAEGGCRPFLWLDAETLLELQGALVESICNQSLPVTMLVEPAPSALSGTHSAVGPGCLQALTGTAALAPAHVGDLERMLDFALLHEAPAAIWLDGLLQEPMGETLPVKLGCGCLMRCGEDLTIIAAGQLAAAAYQAAQRLSVHGVEATVVNLRFVRPLDDALLAEATGKASVTLLLEEAPPRDALAGDVLQTLAARGAVRPIAMFAPAAGSPPSTDIQPNGAADSLSGTVDAIVDQGLRLVRDWTPGSGYFGWSALGEQASQDALSVYPEGLPAQLQDERRTILAERLSPTLEAWRTDYARVGPRDLYLWKWCCLGTRLTTLPCVRPELRAHCCDTKVLSIMINVLLDDVADRRDKGALLPVLMEVTHDGQPDTRALAARDREHVEFTRRVWNEYWKRTREYPRFSEFEDLLRFDLIQLFNAIHYSALLNRQLGLLNEVEHDLYSPHNMMMMSFATVDMMCSPGVDCRELGKLREAVWHAQWMGRIGNLLSTWRREVAVGDFTSGVFARAVARGDLTVDELARGDRDEIEAAVQRGGHHRFYWRRWNYHRRCFLACAAEIRCVNIDGMLAGHERFFRMHLGSRGLI